MTPDHRSDVRILFGDPNHRMRSLYRQALAGAGFNNLREFEDLKSFGDLLAIAQPDVLLMDVGLPEGDACQAVREIRHGRLGSNPFLPAMLTTWDSEGGLVRRAVDSGADDLLVKPLNTKTLVERIEALALQRKPFVVTADYIGPDRRKADARRESSVPLIEVPNPLRAKLNGQPVDAGEMQRALAEANEGISRLRLKQSAFRIAFVAQQVVPQYKSGTADGQTMTLLADLIVSAEEIKRRVAQTELDHVGALCDRLIAPARQISAASATFIAGAEGTKSLDLIKTLSDAVLAFFNPEKASGELAGEIATAIDRYRARMAARAAGQIPTG